MPVQESNSVAFVNPSTEEEVSDVTAKDVPCTLVLEALCADRECGEGTICIWIVRLSTWDVSTESGMGEQRKGRNAYASMVIFAARITITKLSRVHKEF